MESRVGRMGLALAEAPSGALWAASGLLGWTPRQFAAMFCFWVLRVGMVCTARRLCVQCEFGASVDGLPVSTTLLAGWAVDLANRPTTVGGLLELVCAVDSGAALLHRGAAAALVASVERC